MHKGSRGIEPIVDQVRFIDRLVIFDSHSPRHDAGDEDDHKQAERGEGRVAMTLRYNSAISRRGAPEFCTKQPLEMRGRRESRVPVAPAAARVE